MLFNEPSIPWLEPDQDFPPVTRALGPEYGHSGLLAAGGQLSLDTLRHAYSQGIFPWFSNGQPILWWCTDPRMVLPVSEFKLSRSLKKTLTNFQRKTQCEVRIDSAFEKVIRACSASPRQGQSGTWIVEDIVQAYCTLHREGLAHSVETWINGELVGGLYCVALGKAVFGESMFSQVSDSSKIALSALVCFCRFHGIELIDCQQKTSHLASLGARPIPREDFLTHINSAQEHPSPAWQFEPIYWNQLLQ